MVGRARSGVDWVRRSKVALVALLLASLPAFATEAPSAGGGAGKTPTRPMKGVDAEALAEASAPDRHERRIASSHAYEAFLMGLRALQSGDRGQARHWLRQAIAFDPGASAPKALLQSLDGEWPRKSAGRQSAVRASTSGRTARAGHAAQATGRENGSRTSKRAAKPSTEALKRPVESEKSPKDAANVAIDRLRPDR